MKNTSNDIAKCKQLVARATSAVSTEYDTRGKLTGDLLLTRIPEAILCHAAEYLLDTDRASLETVVNASIEAAAIVDNTRRNLSISDGQYAQLAEWKRIRITAVVEAMIK